MSTATVTTVTPHIRDHLVACDSQWAIWCWSGLRAAGFPAADICKLRAPDELLQHAELVIQHEQEIEPCRLAAIDEVNSALDRLRSERQWDDKSLRDPLLKARDGLKSGKLAKIPSALLSLPGMARFHSVLQESEQARALLHQQFSAFLEQQTAAIRAIAASPRFREAVTWQNRSAVQTALLPLIQGDRRGNVRGSHQRQHEELVASYFQRYSVKNDTIGFFGPVGWARIVSDGSFQVNPGPDLLATRKVYFESWAIEKLAEAIAGDVRVFPFLAPVRMPFLRVEDLLLHHPVYGTTPLPPGEAAILRRCDGMATAEQIALELVGVPGLHISDAVQVYQILANLAVKRLIHWGFIIPLGAYPERALQHALDCIRDKDAREQALAMLRQLEAERQQVQTSAGNVEKLDTALGHLESTFTRLTGVPPSRAHGKTYGARTVVYEDCRRDVEVLIGPDLIESLVQPLSLLLVSARWLTSEVARAYKIRFMETYSSLSARLGKRSIDVPTFWVEAMPYLLGEQSGIVGSIQEEFQQRWDRILGLSSAAQPLAHSVEALRDAVHAEFPESHAGWSTARYHSPDVMIAARSPEAIRRGDYTWILGELHVATNTLAASLFVNQHPSPGELLSAVDRDLGRPSVVPIFPKEYKLVSRTVDSLVRPDDWLLEYTSDGFAADRSRALPVSSLVIEENAGELLARSHDGRFCVNIIELVGGFQELVRDAFKFMAPGNHNYRIAIDRLVIMRESWRFPAENLAFAFEQESALRFVRARAWAGQNGLPQCVFFKVPVEPKPAYLDFGSPILIDVFSKMIRRTLEAKGPAAVVELSEMLPGMEDTWLPDSHGNRYTCEFRMVVVDQSK